MCVPHDFSDANQQRVHQAQERGKTSAEQGVERQHARPSIQPSLLHAHTHTLPDGTVIQHAHIHGEHGHSHLNNQGDRWADPTHPYSALPDSSDLATTSPDRIAAHNRAYFAAAHIVALNLVSSPGAGKTALLTRTIQALQPEIPVAVIHSDRATSQECDRLRATGCLAISVKPETGCHLDAKGVYQGLQNLTPSAQSVLMIETVDNLACPTLLDLGETARVVMLSVTAGEDQPLKYPELFRASQVMILNKIDLLPYIQFDVSRCLDYVRRANPQIQIFQVSAMSGEGLTEWCGWVRQQAIARQAIATP